MQTRLSLLYVDCGPKKGGDFAAAAEIAYTLAKHHIFNPDDQSFLLSSSQKGLAVFKRLYGNPMDSSLTIHDIQFHACALEDVSLPQDQYLEHYIEVANCCPAPLDRVSALCHPSYTRILFIGLPHSVMSPIDSRTQPFNPPPVGCWILHPKYSASVKWMITGFGDKQAGIPFHMDMPLSEINHATYRDLTQHPFGLIYIDFMAVSALGVLYDYLSTALHLKKSAHHFMVIGDGQPLALYGLKCFVQHTKKSVICYDYAKNLTISISFDDATSTPTCDEKPFENILVDENAVHVALIPSVSNTEMRKLLRASIPFCASTGIASYLEALAYGKIPLLQALDKNKPFLEAYRAYVMKRSPLIRMFGYDFIANFLELQFRKHRATPHAKLAMYLNNDEFAHALHDFHQTLLRESNEQFLTRLCQALNVSPGTPLLTHSIFSEPAKPKELPEHSPEDDAKERARRSAYDALSALLGTQ